MEDINQIKSIIENHLAKNKQYATVMLPLVREADQSLSLLFQVRSMNLRAQPGEICFPGGRMEEEDVSPEHTGVRELCEELGTDTQNVQILAPLEPIMNPRRGLIYPYVCYLTSKNTLQLNQEEVDSVFTIPLNYLLKNAHEEHQSSIQLTFSDSFPLNQVTNGTYYTNRQFPSTEYVYRFENHVVWGLTARILVDFIHILKENSISFE